MFRVLAALAVLSACVAVSTARAGAPAPRLIPRAALVYERSVIAAAHAEFGLAAPVAVLAAQLEAESAWRPRAASGVGAQGLAQFMPETALDMARSRPDVCAPADPLSPAWAIRCQAAYMHSLLRSIGPMPEGIPPKMAVPPQPAPLQECEQWAMALSAYNGGIGWLQRDRRLTAALSRDPNKWFHNVEFYTKRSLAAQRENRTYPRKIMLDFAPTYAAANWGRAVVCTDL